MIDLQRMRWWQIASIMPIEIDLFGAERWTVGVFWSELAEYASRHYLVATEPRPAGEEPDVVGYAGLSTYGPESYIQTLGVRRDRQGAGIGRALLSALLAEADRRRATSVALEVRADNAVAQRLYATQGFEPVGLRKRYYQPSGTDAVVMVRRAG
ncbi:MAG: ribosomal protein S18-alanine N-acetyltransferase [Mycobacteriales bacterium]